MTSIQVSTLPVARHMGPIWVPNSSCLMLLVREFPIPHHMEISCGGFHL